MVNCLLSPSETRLVLEIAYDYSKGFPTQPLHTTMMAWSLVVLFLGSGVHIAPLAVLVPVLPTIFVDTCETRGYSENLADNVTLRSGEHAQGNCSLSIVDGATRSGLMLGSVMSTQIFAAFAIGWLAPQVNSNWLFCSGLIIQAIGNVFVALSDSIQLLCCAGVIYSVGATVTIVVTDRILAHTFTVDSTRSRVIGLFYLMSTAGFAFHFSISTRAYVRVGHFTFFMALAGVYLVGSVVHGIINCREMRSCRSDVSTDQEHAASKPVSSYESINDDSNTPAQDPATGTYLRLLSEPLALLTFVQMLCVYWTLCTVAITGPARLQQKLSISVVENGSILGVSSAVDFFILMLVIALVDTNTKQWICLMMIILIQATGCVLYPFVNSASMAIVAETAIRSSKAVTMALTPLIFFRIVDVRKVGTYSHATALNFISKNIGFLMGSFTSPWLMKLLGFKNLYFGLAGLLVPLGIAMVSYSDLSESGRSGPVETPLGFVPREHKCYGEQK